MCNKNGCRRKERKQYVYFLDHRQTARVSTHFVSPPFSLSLSHAHSLCFSPSSLSFSHAHSRRVCATARWPVACSFVRDPVRHRFSETALILSGGLLRDTRETRNLYYSRWKSCNFSRSTLHAHKDPRTAWFSRSRWVWSGFSSNRESVSQRLKLAGEIRLQHCHMSVLIHYYDSKK